MADLPSDRVDPSTPFTYCGVDYFGPFFVKEGRKELKRYGALFTCMASRAIHIEIANSLTTDSFLNALRRFLAIRGPIKQLRSDQGTNFIGARNELQKALNEMDNSKIKHFLLEHDCDFFAFKLNVPDASHMGGVWERQIRTVRSVLASMVGSMGTQLDDESLRTFVYEVAAIVNSRPLTTDNLNDPRSLEPLTPNHLLTQKSKVLLPPPGAFQSADLYCRKRWRRVQYLVNEFWTRWRKEYLLSLQPRQKWVSHTRNMKVGDIVIVEDKNTPRNRWQLARISQTIVDHDGRVRKVKINMSSTLDKRGKRTGPVVCLERPIHKLVVLVESTE